MAIGDVYTVESATDCDCYYVDTGMADIPEYGSVYVLDAERPAIVDSGIGTNYERILEGLEAVGIDRTDLEVIATTHVHLDHAGGAGFIAAETGADVYVHESGSRFLADPEPLWEGTKEAVGSQIEFYTEPKPVPEERLRELSDDDVVDLGDLELEVYRAPGHAFHQVVFYEPRDELLFAADAAGIYVPSWDRIVPTSPPPGFDLEGVLDDVEMIAEIGPETICYGHFGPASTDDRLEEYADVITEWVARIESKRAELGDDELVVEYFREETDFDEVWGEKKANAEVAMNVRGVLHYLDD